MASNHDFYVKFGSNAATFGKELKADLEAGPGRVIGAFNKALLSIEQNAKDRRTAVSAELQGMSREAIAVQAQIDKLEQASRQAGVDPSVADVKRIARDTISDFATMTGALDGLISKLASVGEVLTPVARRASARSNSEAQIGVPRERVPAGQRGPQGQRPGTLLGVGSGGVPVQYRAQQRTAPVATRPVSRSDVAAIAQIVASVRGATPTTQAPTVPKAAPTAPPVQNPTPVSISSIPAATIDDAAFDRVVKAIQDNVTATEKVEASVDRIAAILSAQGKASASVEREGEGEAGVERGLKEYARLTRQQNSDLKKTFNELLSKVRDEHGDQAQANLWKQLVEREQKAQVAGQTLIDPKIVREYDESQSGPSKRERGLDKAIADDEAAIRGLRAEIETLAGAMQDGTTDSAAFAAKLNQIDAIEKRLGDNMIARRERESRAEQRERQRRASIREAATRAGVTPETVEQRQYRQAERARLELATDPEKLAAQVGGRPGQLGKADLQAIATTLSRQGYAVDQGNIRTDGPRAGESRLTIPQLIDRIGKAGAQYLRAGRATAEDLRPRRLEQTSTVTPESQRLLAGGNLGRLNSQFTEQITGRGFSMEQAFELLGWDMRTGGQGGMGTQRRGRAEVGGAIGDDLRDLIPEMREVVGTLTAQRETAARADAVNLLRREPGFNPAEEDLRIEGKGQQAQIDRRTQGSVLRAVRDIDTMARHLKQLEKAVDAAEKEFTQAAKDVFEGKNQGLSGASLQPRQDRYDAAQARILETRNTLASSRANFNETMGADALALLSSPAFQEGFRAREANSFQTRDPENIDPSMRGLGRMSYDEAYRENEGRLQAKRMEDRRVLRAATFDTLGGARQINSMGNTRDYFSRMLPGIRATGSDARQRFSYVDEQAKLGSEDKAANARNAKALRTMTAGMITYTRNLNDLIEATADGDRTEEQLNAMRQKVIASLDRTLGAYATAFPQQTQIPDARLFAPANLFSDEQVRESSGGRSNELIDRSDASARRDAGAARNQAAQDKLLSEAEAAFNDPKRAERLQRKILTNIRQRIKAYKEDLRELEAAGTGLTQQRAQATKDLNKALGPKLRAEVAEAEKVLEKYSRNEAIGKPLSDADVKSRDLRQQQIQQAYNASPAIQEAKARRDSIDSLRAENKALQDFKRSLIEAANASRKRVTGRIDKEDIERGQAALQTGRSKTLPEKESALAEATEKLTRVRQEVAASEATTRTRLGEGSSRNDFDKLIAERTSIQEQMATIRNSPEMRADAGDISPQDAAVRDKSEAELMRLNQRLPAIQKSLLDFARLASRLDPRNASDGTAAGRRANRAAPDQEFKALVALTGQLDKLEEEARDDAVELGMVNRQLARQEAELEAMVALRARQEDRRGGKREEPAPAGPGGPAGPSDGGNSGDGSGSGGGDSSAGREGGEGNELSILRQILAKLNSIDTRLKGTLKVSGNVKTTRGTATDGATPTEGAAPTTRRTPPVREAPLRSSEQGRRDFFAAQNPAEFPGVALFNQVDDAATRSARGVTAATELITRGVMSETAVLQLFRDELQQNAAAARTFATQVRQGVGDTRLRGSTSAAARQREREEAKLLRPRDASGAAAGDAYRTRDTGEALTLKAARQAMTEDLRLRRRRAEELRRSTSEERQATQAALAHSQVMSRLSDETKKEIAELERQARAADQSAEAQERLVRQMAQVYGLTQRDLGTGANQTAQATGQIYRGAGIETTGREISGIRNTARDLGHQVDQTAAAGVTPGGLFGEQSAFTRAMFGNTGFWSRVMNSTGTFVVRNFTAGFVFGMTNALQEVLAEAIKTEATFIRVSHALEATGRSAGSLRGDLQGISTEYGTSLNDVYTTAAGLTGLFKTPVEIAGATKVVSQLQMISGGALNAQEAMGALASIQGAFGEELGQGIDGLTHVADVLTSVQNSLGTNVETTAEGVGRMSGLAQQLNLSFEEVAVYSAQIAKLTNQTGAAAGEQFSRILSVMQTGRGRQVLQDNLSEINVVGDDGKPTGETRTTNIAQELGSRDYSAVLTTLSKNWDSLTEEQQQNIAVTIAGQRQAAAFAALMNNGAQSLDAIRRAQESHNAAQERTDALMKTLNGQISILGANFQNLANNLVRSGILDWLGALLMATNWVLRGVNTLFSMINDFVDNTPFVGTLTKWTFALLGFLLVINLLKKSWMGLSATLRANPTAQAFRDGANPGPRLNPDGTPRANPIRERATNAFNRFTAPASTTVARAGQPGYRVFQQEGRREYQTGALARGGGAILDRTLGRPLERAGSGLTSFGNALTARAAQVRQIPFPLQTGSATAQAQQVAADRRANNIGRLGSFFGGGVQRTGTFSSQFNGGLGGLISGGVQGVRNFGTNESGGSRQSFQARRDSAGIQSVLGRQEAARLRAGGDAEGARAADRYAQQQQRSARLNNVGAQTLGRVNSAMTGLRNSGIGADAAMIGLSFAMMALFTAMNDTATAAKVVNDVMEARAKSERAAKGEDDPYKGVAQEGYEEVTKNQRKGGNSFLGGLSFVGNSLKDLGSATPIGWAVNGDVQISSAFKPITGETYNEMTGTTGGWSSDTTTGLSKAQKLYNTSIDRIDRYVKEGSRTEAEMMEEAAKLDEAKPDKDGRITLRPLGEEFAGSVEAIQVALREGNADFDAEMDKINNNEDYSEQEKAAALAGIEQARDLMKQKGEAALAAAAGLDAAAVLGLEQIKRVRESMANFQALQGTGELQGISAGATALVGETGITEKTNPEVFKYLDDLSKGNLDAVEAAKGNAETVRALAKQAENKYISNLASGVDADVLEDSRTEFQTLMQQLAGLVDNQIQVFVGNANAIADAAYALGNFDGGAAAIQTSIENLEGLKVQPTVIGGGTRLEEDGTKTHVRSRVIQPTGADAETNLKIDAQIRSQYDKLNQQSQLEQNANLQKRQASGLGEVAAARNNLQQARNNLNILQQSRAENGPLGATFQQIHEAQLQVLQQKVAMAQALLNGDLAGLALQGAQSWSQAAKDGFAEDAALLQLQAAREEYGRGSAQAQQANASYVNQQHTTQQNADARAQAERDAQLAAIPQGNAVGVANQQVTNAQAALAAAEKYGTSSTEYQGALSQLYSAQQSAMNAQNAVAVAQAQLGQAYAQARGDAVAAARAGANVARATLAAALASSGGAMSAEVLGAQAQLVAANEAIDDAQVALIQSRINVSVALAEAAGNTVKAARLQIKVALAAMNEATVGTAEYNQAKADVIRSRAAARDAALQDQLDTIDFNLQMGKITQSAAINALQQILRTQDLTKAQRRQLLLQIKGMKESMSDSQWNFGDIDLPTPYQMRRYIEERKEGFRRSMDASAAGAARQNGAGQSAGSGFTNPSVAGSNVTNNVTNNNIRIDGTDTGAVERILRKVVGGNTSLNRTTGARRGGRP